ncbi:MAG: sugar phosphate nucleotidyltransferase [Thermoanaerobaculia bacterium]
MTVFRKTDTRRKSRITITLSPEILERLDRQIDGRSLRNRSQAIESLLGRSLRPSVRTAVILAGGGQQKERLPALSPIDGEALIAHTLRHARDHGIRSFVVLAGEGEGRIREFLGDGKALGMSLHYIREPQPRGTAGALKLAEPLLPDEPFLVIHGDVLTNIDLSGFIEFHFNENAMATMAVKPREADRRFGKVMLQGNRITRFLGTSGNGGISLVNTGVYLFQPSVFGLIDSSKPMQLERDVFPKLAEMGQLSAFLFQGIWYDISTPRDYSLANSRWRPKGG